MNIFAIEGDEKTGQIDWFKSGKSLDNLRTVKMILESTQLLSTAMHVNGMEGCYKITHQKHPSTIWATESFDNWSNLYIHALSMCEEYTDRFGKIHKCQEKIREMGANVDLKKFPSVQPTPLRLAMPEEFKSSNPVNSYRNYYVTKERMRYPANKIPSWFLERRKITFNIL